tara:strand:+ start:1362 stop:1481 length:120 start_codon:yes stop_codon:yes gene_type:complete
MKHLITIAAKSKKNLEIFLATLVEVAKDMGIEVDIYEKD